MPGAKSVLFGQANANRANAAKRLVPKGFAPVRSGANRAQARPIRIGRRRCASWKSSRRACLRGIRRFRMGHCTRGVLPGQNPIRGARARRFDSVRVQTEVCRVCGLHPGGRIAGKRKTVLHKSALLTGVADGFLGQTGLNGDRGEPEENGTHGQKASRVRIEFVPLQPKNGHPYCSQYWRVFRAISWSKNGKTATVRFGRKKRPAVRADPWAGCSQAMR